MQAKLSLPRVSGKSLTAFGLLLCGPAAWAGVPVGGTIEYEPLTANVAAVPSLSEWMLVLLGLLLAVMAYRALRGRVNGRLLSNLTLAGGALAAAAAGHGLIQEVRATPAANEQNMSSASGGTVETTAYWTRLTNTSGVPLKIKAIRPNEWSHVVSPPPEAPECTVNFVVSPGNTCNVAFERLDG